MASNLSPLCFATKRQVANCRVIATELRDWKRNVERDPEYFIGRDPFVSADLRSYGIFYPYTLQMRTLGNLFRSSPNGEQLREFYRLDNLRTENPQAYAAEKLRTEVASLRAEVAELKAAQSQKD